MRSQRESFRRLRVIYRWRHALALTPALASLGRRKGTDRWRTIILRLLLLTLLLFILVFLIEHEVECRRERAIGTVVIENGVHWGALRDGTKNNRWPAGRATGGGSRTRRRATGSWSGGERVARYRRRGGNTGMCMHMWCWLRRTHERGQITDPDTKLAGTNAL